MERQLYEKIMIKNRRGEIIAQFFCENGIRYVVVEGNGCLFEIKIFHNNDYIGSIECCGGSFTSKLYYWNDNCDLIFVREEGDE